MCFSVPCIISVSFEIIFVYLDLSQVADFLKGLVILDRLHTLKNEAMKR